MWCGPLVADGGSDADVGDPDLDPDLELACEEPIESASVSSESPPRCAEVRRRFVKRRTPAHRVDEGISAEPLKARMLEARCRRRLGLDEL